jgi:hypothetical protein
MSTKSIMPGTVLHGEGAEGDKTEQHPARELVCLTVYRKGARWWYNDYEAGAGHKCR